MCENNTPESKLAQELNKGSIFGKMSSDDVNTARTERIIKFQECKEERRRRKELDKEEEQKMLGKKLIEGKSYDTNLFHSQDRGEMRPGENRPKIGRGRSRHGMNRDVSESTFFDRERSVKNSISMLTHHEESLHSNQFQKLVWQSGNLVDRGFYKKNEPMVHKEGRVSGSNSPHSAGQFEDAVSSLKDSDTSAWSSASSSSHNFGILKSTESLPASNKCDPIDMDEFPALPNPGIKKKKSRIAAKFPGMNSKVEDNQQESQILTSITKRPLASSCPRAVQNLPGSVPINSLSASMRSTTINSYKPQDLIDQNYI